MKRFVFVFMIFSFLFVGCGPKGSGVNDDVVIIFTGDIQCAATNSGDRIGYSKIKAFKEYAAGATNSHVVLVDAGGFASGDGAASSAANKTKGAVMVDFLNRTGYDYVVLSDEELKYGIESAGKNISNLSARTLSCNLSKSTDSRDRSLSGVNVEYAVERFGKTKIAFIGITTPDVPEEVEMGAYSFKTSTDTAGIVGHIVNIVLNENIADYVVLLTHLGTSESFSVDEIIGKTSGVTAIIDGHTPVGKATREDNTVLDQNGQPVYYGHCGRYGEKIGVLKIKVNPDDTDNEISLKYYNNADLPFEDYELANYIEKNI